MAAVISALDVVFVVLRQDVLTCYFEGILKFGG
jgi:hypothetical protein